MVGIHFCSPFFLVQPGCSTKERRKKVFQHLEYVKKINKIGNKPALIAMTIHMDINIMKIPIMIKINIMMIMI